MEKKIALLINTCDKFEDCWEPFFKLFILYWPSYTGIIYLNTEEKDFSYPGLNIHCLKIGKQANNKPYSWSQCLQRALDKIPNSYILYLQEDYFFTKPVKDKVFQNAFNFMLDQPSIACLHFLSTIGTGKTFYKNTDFQILERSNTEKFSVSCQLAVWKKEILYQYLKPKESGWEFEKYGSIRARYKKGNFYNLQTNNNEYIFPYMVTGIVKGKWRDTSVKNLFEVNGIKVDYSIRGFNSEISRNLYQKVAHKLVNKLFNIKGTMYRIQYFLTRN